MIVQLLRERNAEAPQFSLHELELFQRHFRDYGVSLKSFQKIVSRAHWESVREGDTIVSAGVPLDRVIVVHDGNAVAYKEGLEGELRWRQKLYEYEGRGRNGCIIGGTALVDPRTTRHPYPQVVLATGGADEILGGDSEALVERDSDGGVREGKNRMDAKKYTIVVSWDREELKSLMEADKTLEAAFVHTLYIDLISGLRRQRTANKQRSGPIGTVAPSDREPAEEQQLKLDGTPVSGDADHKSAGTEGAAAGPTGADVTSSSTSVAEHAEQERIRERLQQYRDMLLDAIIDPEESEGFAELNPRKKRAARLFARREGISMAQHVATLSSMGWTRHEWMDGCRGPSVTQP